MGATVGAQLDTYSEYGSLHVDTNVSYSLPTQRSGENKLALLAGKENFSFKLKEAYYDWYGSFWGFRVGRQVVTWGVADSLVLTNVLCPADNTKLSAETVAESKLGIDAVKLSFNTDSLLLDAYWVPFFRPSTLPIDDTNPLKSAFIPSSVEYGGMSIAVKSFSSNDLELPEKKLKNSEFGVRLSGFTSLMDFSFYGFYGWDSSPMVGYNLALAPSPEISLKGSYQRMSMVGADASIPVGEITVRLETAFYPSRAFNVAAVKQLTGAVSEVYEKHNELSFLGGFDWMKEDWTVTAQYYGDYAFGSMDNLSRRSYEHKGTVSVSKDFLDGNLSVNFAALAGLTDWDSAIIGGVSYSLSDELTIKLNSIFFNAGPKATGTYGAYKDLSFFSFKGTYSF